MLRWSSGAGERADRLGRESLGEHDGLWSRCLYLDDTRTQIYLVSEGTGKPSDSTLMLSLHLFLAAFQDLDMGYASAVAWILFLLLAAATWLLFRTSRRWVHYA